MQAGPGGQGAGAAFRGLTESSGDALCLQRDPPVIQQPPVCPSRAVTVLRSISLSFNQLECSLVGRYHRFHIMGHVGDAVDRVRKQEHRALKRAIALDVNLAGVSRRRGGQTLHHLGEWRRPARLPVDRVE